MRRTFLRHSLHGIGSIALAHLLADHSRGEPDISLPHFPAKARNVIFLMMAGGPSQIDLLDPKPKLQQLDGQPIPQEIVEGERFAFLRGELALMASPYRFAKHGESGAVFSELLPHLAKQADDLTIVRSLHTDAFNHDPAQLLLNSGSSVPGRPSMGAWLTYGLGSACENLPGFIVMASGTGQPVGAHCWENGFLPTNYQGVPFLSKGTPVPFLDNPDWISRESRRRSLNAIKRLNEIEFARASDQEILTRTAAYEMAFEMQASVPDLLDIATEQKHVSAIYGSDIEKPSFARNCLLARRMVERGVRFVQLIHRGWDHHGSVETGGIDNHLPLLCRDVDQPVAGLIQDLKERDLLDSTLVVWAGEFGRTPIREVTSATRYLGRDHHPRAFTVLMAGGGIKPGITYGATDELGYNVTNNGVHLHDLHATMLHCLGIDHKRLTYRFKGRDFRLTDVSGNVVRDLLS
ncbi:MAG: DUF1501 domain-containing protein [Planctomycetota bacterium]|nr:DUF1501 domain-containing protein [Planctomycetota bacterium]